MRTVVFVMGSGHCGSTLLDLILGSHSEAFSLGEIGRIRHPLDARRRDPEAKVCGVCAERCSFWDERVPPLALKAFFSSANPAWSLARKATNALANPYAHLMRWSGASVLIDSSKRPKWIERQLRMPHRWRGIRPVLIYLKRDGRAVVCAYYRKYPERGFDAITRDWQQGEREMDAFFEAYDRGPKLEVSYEALASRPEQTVREICSAIGLQYEADMLCYWKHDHHHVFGNGGTRNLIYRYREQFQDMDPTTRERIENHKQFYPHEYYDQIEVAIKLDERWRRELTTEQIARFDELTGAAPAAAEQAR